MSIDNLIKAMARKIDQEITCVPSPVYEETEIVVEQPVLVMDGPDELRGLSFDFLYWVDQWEDHEGDWE